MSHPITVCLSRPITSVKILESCPGSAGGEPIDFHVETPTGPSPDCEAQKARFSQVCHALNDAATRLNEFYDKVIVEHREEIAKLSVEIARRILVQKVENGDYEIESIIKEALKHAPSRHDIVVHLNPEDHAQCQQALQQEQQDSAFVGIQFVSDWSIGRAECMLETPKGIIKSLVDENLERIRQALKKA